MNLKLGTVLQKEGLELEKGDERSIGFFRRERRKGEEKTGLKNPSQKEKSWMDGWKVFEILRRKG